MYENNIKVARVNEHYFRLAGIWYKEGIDYNKKFWNHVRDDDRDVLFASFAQAYENPAMGAQCYVHFLRSDGTTLWVYIRLSFLREKDVHKIFYGSLTDMTSLHEEKNEAINNILLSYREVYFVQLQDNYCQMIYPYENHLPERGNYESVVRRHFGTDKRQTCCTK